MVNEIYKICNFYGKNLHVIPKVPECCFVTKKFDFLDFGVRDGDKMAVASCHDCLTTSERFHIYRKTDAFLERWRIFLLHRNAKTVTAQNWADNN